MRVRPEAAEVALAALAELFPAGLEEAESDGAVEFASYGAPGALPPEAAVRGALGDALVEIVRMPVAPGWERRWHAHLDPVDVAAGGCRLRVRPPWAPRHPDPAVIDLPVAPGEAFGAGAHPTTRLCLELLLERRPGGGLAMAAARLGWAPVTAVERDPAALEALRANGVAARRLDLQAQAPPWAPTITANLPRPLQLRLAARAQRPPETLIASGLLGREAGEVAAAWAARGLRERARPMREGWAGLLLERAG
jgi:ribosomal protein L11 methyltransferase